MNPSQFTGTFTCRDQGATADSGVSGIKFIIWQWGEGSTYAAVDSWITLYNQVIDYPQENSAQVTFTYKYPALPAGWKTAYTRCVPFDTALYWDYVSKGLLP